MGRKWEGSGSGEGAGRGGCKKGIRKCEWKESIPSAVLFVGAGEGGDLN